NDDLIKFTVLDILIQLMQLPFSFFRYLSHVVVKSEIDCFNRIIRSHHRMTSHMADTNSLPNSSRRCFCCFAFALPRYFMDFEPRLSNLMDGCFTFLP